MHLYHFPYGTVRWGADTVVEHSLADHGRKTDLEGVAAFREVSFRGVDDSPCFVLYAQGSRRGGGQVESDLRFAQERIRFVLVQDERIALGYFRLRRRMRVGRGVLDFLLHLFSRRTTRCALATVAEQIAHFYGRCAGGRITRPVHYPQFHGMVAEFGAGERETCCRGKGECIRGSTVIAGPILKLFRQDRSLHYYTTEIINL